MFVNCRQLEIQVGATWWFAGALSKRINAIYMSVDYANGGGGGGQSQIDTDEQLRLVSD